MSGLAQRGFTAAALLLLFAAPLAAFELERVNNDPCSTSQNLFWDPASAPVDPNPLAPQRFRQLGETARSRWNASVGTFRFETGSGDFCNFDDGVAAMGFAQTSCDGSDLGDAIAVTITRFNSRSGRLIDANIVFDANTSLFANEALFLEVAMHELGHVLGLDHSDECGQSGAGTLMKKRILLQEPRLEAPQADDIAGANFIYSGGSDDGGTALEGESCAIGVRPGTGWPAAVLLAALVALRRMRGKKEAADTRR